MKEMVKSERSSSLYLFCSGFGPFGDVKVNPSSAIAKRVVEMFTHQEEKNVKDANDNKHTLKNVNAFYTELETSIVAVNAYFDELDTRLYEILQEEPNAQILLCPLGLHSREENGVLRLEVRAYNELFASIPDVRGELLNHQPIDAQCGSADTFLESWFAEADSNQLMCMQRYIDRSNNLLQHEASTTSMKDKRHDNVDDEEVNKNKDKVAHHSSHELNPIARLVTTHDKNDDAMTMPLFRSPTWTISINAGRYLCNCALYHALMLQNKYAANVAAVFIHIVDPSKEIEQTILNDQHDDSNTRTTAKKEVMYNPTIITQVQAVGALVHELLILMSQR